jgi:hypothetical protein
MSLDYRQGDGSTSGHRQKQNFHSVVVRVARPLAHDFYALALVDGVLESPNQHSRLLTKVLLESAAGPVATPMKVPERLGLDLLHAPTRRFQGNELADALGIRRAWISVLLPLLLGRIDLLLAPADLAGVRNTIARFRAQIAAIPGQTVYQSAPDANGSEDLPRVRTLASASPADRR